MIFGMRSRDRALEAEPDSLTVLVRTVTEERDRLKRELEQCRHDCETWKRAANAATIVLNRVRAAIAEQQPFAYRLES